MYIDDIVVVGKTVQNHLDNLQLVLDRIKRAGLRLKPSKCHLFQKEILYLGHRITRDGVATDPGKIDAVRKWAVPRTVQEVQTFLGLVGYYRKFVNNFAATAKPLYRLTERGREFNWTTECEAAFLDVGSFTSFKLHQCMCPNSIHRAGYMVTFVQSILNSGCRYSLPTSDPHQQKKCY